MHKNKTHTLVPYTLYFNGLIQPEGAPRTSLLDTTVYFYETSKEDCILKKISRMAHIQVIEASEVRTEQCIQMHSVPVALFVSVFCILLLKPIVFLQSLWFQFLEKRRADDALDKSVCQMYECECNAFKHTHTHTLGYTVPFIL